MQFPSDTHVPPKARHTASCVRVEDSTVHMVGVIVGAKVAVGLGVVGSSVGGFVMSAQQPHSPQPFMLGFQFPPRDWQISADGTHSPC